MTCEELRRILEEEGTASSEPARAHLAGCPACAREAERWAAVLVALRELGQEPAPPFLHARIMAHVRTEAAPRRERRWHLLRGWRAPALAAAGAAVVILGLGLYQAVHPPVAEVNKVARAVTQDVEVVPGGQRPPASSAPSVAAAPMAPSESESSGPLRHELEADVREARAKKVIASKAGSLAEDAERRGASTADAVAASGPAPAPARAATRRERAATSPSLDETHPPPLAGLLRSAETAGKGRDLVRCRLQVEGEDEAVELLLPAGQAPPADEVWLVTVHADGQLDLRDSQGERQLAPLVLQQSIGQQRQIRSGRYRLSQAPVPPTP